MEAMSPIAMWVDELARTPEKNAALKAEKGSLEKPEKKVVVKKVVVDVELENAELKKELKLKVDAEVKLKVEVELTRERLREMQDNVTQCYDIFHFHIFSRQKSVTLRAAVTR